MNFTAVGLVHSNRASFLFVVQLRLFDECCNQIFNCAVLGDQNIKGLLKRINNVAQSKFLGLTSFDMPSLSQTTLKAFLVSSSVRLMSRTSK